VGNPRAAAKEMAEARRRRLTHRGRRHRARRALRGARSGGRGCGGRDTAVGRAEAAMRLWGDGPPPSAPSTVRVARLRAQDDVPARGLQRRTRCLAAVTSPGAGAAAALSGVGTVRRRDEKRREGAESGEGKAEAGVFFFNFLCRGPLAPCPRQRSPLPRARLGPR